MMLVFVVTGVANADEHAYPLPASLKSRQNTMITISPSGDAVVSFVTPLHSGYRIGMAISSDAGGAWREIDSISYMRASMVGLQRRPTIVKSDDGSLVCTYEDQKVGDLMPRVYVTRCVSEGAPWTTPLAVVRGFQADMQDFASMASDGRGRLAIAFISADNMSSGRHLYVVTSSDYGVNWSDPVRANTQSPNWEGNACECCMTSIAYSSTGILGVAFRANRNDVRDVHVAFSRDNGATFESPILIQDGKWTIAGCPSTGPNLKFDNQDTAHISWRDYRDAVLRPVVYYAKCAVGSLITPRNVDLSTSVSDDADYPSVSVSPDGKIVTVIHESSNGVRIAVSRDGGETFDSRVVDPFIKRNASCYTVEIPNGTSMAIWTSINDGRFDVAMTVGAVTSVSSQSGLLVAKDNVRNMLLYSEWAEVPDNATVSAFDVSGRAIELEEQQDSPRRVRPVSSHLTFVSVSLPESITVFAMIRGE
ncbi:MAG TPA: sialidase family protein [Candidatus Didemnitutus sp.]|nr:sialidase family protein [Candidatus Didemnitutus sp.]